MPVSEVDFYMLHLTVMNMLTTQIQEISHFQESAIFACLCCVSQDYSKLAFNKRTVQETANQKGSR